MWVWLRNTLRLFARHNRDVNSTLKKPTSTKQDYRVNNRIKKNGLLYWYDYELHVLQNHSYEQAEITRLKKTFRKTQLLKQI